MRYLAHAQRCLRPILCRALTGCHGKDTQETICVTLQNKIHSVVYLLKWNIIELRNLFVNGIC